MQNLGVFLDYLEKDLHRVEFLNSDPLEFVHHYRDPWDQECVALLSAVLAYGNVKQIRRSIRLTLELISQLAASPSQFIRRLESPGFQRHASSIFHPFVHRFNRGADLIILARLLEKSWSRYGSLGTHFLTHLGESEPDFEMALNALIRDWKSWSNAWFVQSSFSYLLTAPEDGSCCKRWCMFLRWMGRKDDLDPGLWTLTSPLVSAGRALRSDQLVMPLDTHTGRISQYLGLTHRKTLNWKAALEITAALKKISPQDPVRYDFALSRLGILDLCQAQYVEGVCEQCQLFSVCKLAQSGRLAIKRKKKAK